MPQLGRRRQRPSGACVAATTRPPSAQMRPHQPGERLLRGGVERGGRLVEEPEGAARDEQAGERQPPALAGREIGDGRSRRVREPDRLERLAGRRGRVAEKVAGEGEVLGRRQRRSSGRRDGRRDGAPRRACRSPMPSARTVPRPARSRPARIASRLDLPAPLRPVTTSASPLRRARTTGPRKRAARSGGRQRSSTASRNPAAPCRSSRDSQNEF